MALISNTDETSGAAADDDTDRPAAVSVENLGKTFRIYHQRNQSLKQSLLQRKRADTEQFWALTDVSFKIYQGETFGIIGHNGSGKSTLLKCLTKILEPDRGKVAVTGSVSALLELGAGFHPELSGRENVFLNAAILGVPRKQIAKRFDEIVAFADLEQFIDTPVKNYSSGMFVRLGFAVATNVDPDILVIDEVLAVGDAEFQARCRDKIAEFRENGKTIILVTHDMLDAIRICHRTLWLDGGHVRMVGDPAEIAGTYLQTTDGDKRVRVHDDSRWGNGDLKIEGVRLLDADRNEIEWAQTGRPLTIRLELVSDRAVHNPDIRLEFVSINSAQVSAISTRSRGLTLDTVDGVQTIEFTIDDLPLNEGTYDITFAALDSVDRTEFDVRNRYIRFDVLRGENTDGGLITMNGSWSLPDSAS